MMHYFSDCIGHCYGMSTLKNITPHIKAARSVADCMVCQCERFLFGKLLAAGDYNRYRTCGEDFTDSIK